jgi:hypothetical protein
MYKTGDMVECFLPLLFMINDNDLLRDGDLLFAACSRLVFVSAMACF